MQEPLKPQENTPASQPPPDTAKIVEVPKLVVASSNPEKSSDGSSADTSSSEPPKWTSSRKPSGSSPLEDPTKTLLMALGATVTLQAGKSSREVPLDAYFTGYKASVRQPDELITAISWPRPDAASTSRFYKLARRKGDAITVVGVSVLVAMKSGVCTEVRVALGAVGPCVFRARTAEALLRGQAPTAERVARAAVLAAAEATPIDDIRATGAYRKEQVEVLVGRLLNQTIESLS